MYKDITEEQYQTAVKILKQTAILSKKRDQIAKNDPIFKEINLPSHIWKQGLDYFKYFNNNPTFDLINSLRFHTFAFSGNYIGYWIDLGISKEPPNNLLQEVQEVTTGIPREYIIDFPEILGEVGFKVNGVIVNKEFVMYQRHLRRLYFTGLLDYLKNIKNGINYLEIGAGYGALPLSINKILNPKTTVIVDLPESLSFSAIYLTIAGNYKNDEFIIYNGENLSEAKLPKIIFCPNYLIDNLIKDTKLKFDFVINTGSLGEMSEKQVDIYGYFIKNNLNIEGVFYEVNQNTFVPVTDIINKYLKYKYRINIDSINEPLLWFLKEDSQIKLLLYNHFEEIPKPLDICSVQKPLDIRSVQTFSGLAQTCSNMYWRICFALPKIIKSIFRIK